MEIKYFSTFSGIGGFEKAIHDIIPNAKCVGFSEIDKYAKSVYLKHFPSHKDYGDITKIDIQALPDFDLLVGGSPCQDLSIAKKDRKGLQGDRSGLFYKFVEILKVKKPKYFILENVFSMGKENKDKISEILGVQPVMINASLVSAQNRKRLFWANFLITQPEDRGILLKDILEDYINGDRIINPKLLNFKGSDKKSVSLTATSYKEPPKVIRIGHLNKGGQGDRIYSPEGKSVNLSANGGGRGAKTGLYAVALRNRGQGKKPEFGGDKANAMTTVQTDSMIMKDTIIRKLTPTECARLQCFDDNWCEGISNSQQYKCYGNSVCVEVVKHIMSNLILWNQNV